MTGGRFAGRLLRGPGRRALGGARDAAGGSRLGFRPSGARLRKSLFGVLGSELAGAVVFDVCAGAGTLGFEALSRGAAQCVFFERDAAMRRLIGQNAALLGLREVEIRSGDAAARLEDAAARLGVPAASGRLVDFVFCDPPWAAWSTPRGQALFRAALGVRPRAAAFEHPADHALPGRVVDRGREEVVFFRKRRRVIGWGAYSLYRRDSRETAPFLKKVPTENPGDPSRF